MKTVFGSHANLAHAWASGSYERGKSGDERMFFTGRTIYSYRSNYPIGTLMGDNVAALNGDSYSISTSKHQGHVRGAVSHMRAVWFSVEELNILDNGIRSDMQQAGKKIWESAQKRIGEAIAKALATAKRARKHADWHNAEAGRHFANLLAIGALLQMDTSALKQSELAASAAEAIKATEDARKARDKAEKEREAKQRQTILDANFPDCWRAGVPCRAEYDGETYELTAYQWERVGGHTLLRRSSDGQCETSRGASVPWNEALKLYTFAARIRGKGYAPPPDVKCGPYSLTSIDATGNVLIGCHELLWIEMELLAAREGVTI